MGVATLGSRSRRVLAELSGKTERLILETLTRVYPAGLNNEEVAARAGYEANGGDFNNALGRMRTLKLVQGRGEQGEQQPCSTDGRYDESAKIPLTIRSDTDVVAGAPMPMTMTAEVNRPSICPSANPTKRMERRFHRKSPLRRR